MKTDQDLSKMEQDLLGQAFRTIRSLKTPIVLDALLREHRTNQQSFWRQIIHLVHAYGALDRTHFDARNEASWLLTSRLVEELGQDGSLDGLGYLPLI